MSQDYTTPHNTNNLNKIFYFLILTILSNLIIPLIICLNLNDNVKNLKYLIVLQIILNIIILCFLILLIKKHKTFNFSLKQPNNNKHLSFSSDNAESSLKEIGEYTSLIINDLSSPLHSINLFIESLKENPHFATQKTFIEHLKLNVHYAIILLKTLKSFTKDPTNLIYENSYFIEVYNYVLRLLETKFTHEIKKVSFIFDYNLYNTKINIAFSNLTHIFLNIYSIVLENLLNKNSSNIIIKTTIVKKSDNWITLSISTIGNTESSLLAENTLSSPLTLKLTEKLIEKNNGKLQIIKSSKSHTTILLTLPVIY